MSNLVKLRVKFLFNFHSEFRHFYFRENSDAAVKVINAWVSVQTKKKIQNILTPGDIDCLTRLIIVNTIYFKADWAKQFDAELTHDGQFKNAAGETVTVRMMFNKKIKTNYGAKEKLHCKILELPYVKKSISMFIILPDEHVTSLKEMEEKLTEKDLVNLEKTFKMSREYVRVWLPRFKLDKSLSLKKTLSAVGMNEMFLEEKADFSGINGTKELHVSKVSHRASIEVNEEGSEAYAAAIGYSTIYGLDESYNKTVDFRADHPFLFFIRDNNTQSILFLGRFVNPGSSTELIRQLPFEENLEQM